MLMLSQIVGGLNPLTVSKYFAAAVYIAALSKAMTKTGTRFHLWSDNALAVLFGPAWAIAVCGALVNNVYFRAMAARDKTTRLGRGLGDVFGHILPALVVTIYAPAAFPVTGCTYSAGVILLVALCGRWLQGVYVGVPWWVVWALAPAIALGATHAKYWPPRL